MARAFQQELCMKKVLIGLFAAATLFAVSAPAMAQDFRMGGPGVSVRIGDGDRGYRHNNRRDYRGHYGHSRRYVRDTCREVVVRKRLPNGTTVIRRTQRC
jgi:hypothetical protein